MQTESKTLERVREAQEAITSAQLAMDKVQAGLSGVESVAETADKARRHPMATAAILVVIGLGAALTFVGLRNTEEE
ncbi:MAG: hypothetical protein PVJ28_01455 [Acidimicrobiia bacterium]|jgi:hypothetical protein